MDTIYRHILLKFFIIGLCCFSLSSAGSGSGALPADPGIVHYDTANEWLENNDTLGGAIIDLSYSGLDNGSCVVQLPAPVNLFHVMNGFIVPDQTSTAQGLYTITAPTHWSLVNGTTFQVLIIFDSEAEFDLSTIVFGCDPTDIEDINVYSFPQNNLEGEASSTVCYRPAFHVDDVLTITFPVPVAYFNITTGDPDLSFTNLANTTFTITGFQHPIDNDFNTEVSFSILYEDTVGVTNWFSAGDISVSVSGALPPFPPGLNVHL